MSKFREGDLVQVISPHAFATGQFAKVTKTFPWDMVAIRLVFGDEQRELQYYPDELKLIRAAEKPGWERHGFVRNTHRWRMWPGDYGWTAVQPAQCDDPLFRTGYGVGGRSYRATLAELELAILKGKAALDLQEALS